MRAGRLRKRVEIQSTGVTGDGGGGVADEGWETDATVYASIEPLSGAERFQAQQVSSSVTHRITIRHRTVTSASRLKYDDRVFAIEAVLNPDERNREAVLLCSESDNEEGV